VSIRRMIKFLTVVGPVFAILAGSTHAQEQNTGGELSKKLDIETYTFYFGQYDRLDFRQWGPRLACERASDPEVFKKWIQELCGAEREAFWKAATPDVSGTMCGYHGFAVACVKLKENAGEQQEPAPASTPPQETP
jgi:hypothetical protein